VDRLEALTGAESRDGQQPMLVGDIPGVPFGAPRGLEQRHFHHVDHAGTITAFVEPKELKILPQRRKTAKFRDQTDPKKILSYLSVFAPLRENIPTGFFARAEITNMFTMLSQC
jgi:hypothetical protein